MADAVVSVLVENLGKFLVDQVNLIREALSEVEQVLKEVEKLKAFLGDPVIQMEEGFRVLAMEVREVVYAAQDISDSFIILELEAQVKRNIQYISYLPNHLERRLSLAKHLISFRRTKLARMLKRIDQIPEFHMPNTLHPYAHRQHSPLFLNQVPTISPDNIVGFEDEAATIMKNLMTESDELDVISITGMPGIGKTTLAWKIFHDPDIEHEFPIRIWVNLPDIELDRHGLYLHILKEFTEQDDPTHDEYTSFELVCSLNELLGDIKFLLVFDNVWTYEAWSAIEFVLPVGNKTGKVLITSQNNDACMTSRCRHTQVVLQLLNEQESWELLQLQVFGELNICPPWMQVLGETVARNCHGLPLAIQIIGSNLVVAKSTNKAKELTLYWWEKVGRNVSMYVTQYSQQGASSVLDISYNVLPQRLKDCFVYLGVFPEDYEIPASTLTRLWVAEGFIGDVSSSGRVSLEDVAYGVLEELVSRNLVMVGESYYNGNVKTCGVHRVIHGFCKFKALEQNLFQEIKMSEEEDFDPPVSLTPNYRRLCIHSNLHEYLSRKPYGPGVRSFLCFQKGSDELLETKHTSTIRKAFKFLKVFESSSIKFAEFPIKFTRLMNLTYISLCSDHLSVLPETISHLLNLQTLVVATESPVLEIKGNIWKMIKLRHLITKAAISLRKQGKDEGSGELQTLTRLSPGYCTKEVFEKACYLKKLGIRGRLRLDHLESWKQLPDGGVNGPHQRSCFPSGLTSLTLSATRLEWQHMSTLGKMVRLKVLKLRNNAGSGDSWNFTDGEAFQNLEFLLIDSTELVSWEVSPHCFASLQCLVLEKCEKLDKIPMSLARSLETLKLDHVSESAEESGREMKEKVEEEGGSRELKLFIHPST